MCLNALGWLYVGPRKCGLFLLQCKLQGKALEVVAALTFEDGLNYDLFKNAILQAYELVPAVYRQRFRNLSSFIGIFHNRLPQSQCLHSARLLSTAATGGRFH